MHLKSLELVGFKSFVNKTVLEFHRGITSVVGPNGCGKSNILDAIRWCLGEQSAKALRGGEMADVIFSGTDTRQAVGMAEVSLTFGDCEKDLGTEWNEVRVTRRIFRDGKSEYLVNKNPCRLRDIHEMFMDTGIGRSSYSIMEQGKIDLILSSRPEDRRAVFEEAAGVTKFKAQKKEALRKLEYTEGNLVRLGDIMREVKRQIGSLQRQAGKARRYQALHGNLRVLELHLADRQGRELSQARSDLAARLARLEGEWEERNRAVEEGEARVAGMRAELAGLEGTVEGERAAMQSLRDRMVNAESRVRFNRETLAQIENDLRRCEAEILAATERRAVQEMEIGEADRQLAEVAAELAARAGSLDRLQARTAEAAASRRQAQQDLENKRREIARAEQDVVRLQGEMAALEARRENARNRLENLESEMRQLGQLQDAARQRFSETEAGLSAATDTLRQAMEELDKAEAALEAGETARQQVETELGAAQRELAQSQSRLDVLRQLNLEGEGASPGTQAVLRGLDNPGWFKPAVRGLLGDLLQVDEGCVAAVEAALNGVLDSVVFTDPEKARQALETLRSGRMGRAVLALIPAETRSPRSGMAPAGGWLADRVRCEDPAIEAWCRGLLDGVVLCDSLTEALAVREADPTLAAATRDGDFSGRDGLLAGGAAREGTGSALQRRQEITALERELGRHQARIESHEARRREVLEQREQTRRDLEAARIVVRERQEALAGLRANHVLLEKELREAGSRLSALEAETNRVRGDVEAAGQRTVELAERTAARAEEARAAGEASVRAEAALEAATAGEAELQAEFNEVRVQVAAGRQLEESLKRQRAPMAGRLEELRELIEARRREIATADARKATIEEESSVLGRDAGELQEALATRQAALDELQRRRGALAGEVREAEEGLRTARREHAELHEQRGRLEVQAAELRLRLESLEESVRQRHHLELAAFAPDSYALHCAVRDHRKRRKTPATEAPNENGPAGTESESGGPGSETDPSTDGPHDWEEIAAFVQELRERIDAMGPVNLEAIQEFDELLERQTFLDQQFNDLTKSKEELLEVIRRINATTTTLFAETFSQIRENFRETFRELFGGGKADLALIDDTDPLECGIEITAKPPGKQLQSVSLLSGGERTMTAVALLFAIYMVKPSPFCILDEMDAPLDESNINRFLAMLDRFVAQSQFLVITHNKRTIAKADVLYGVTMEEQGVSKLVGVRFVDNETRTAAARPVDRAAKPASAR